MTEIQDSTTPLTFAPGTPGWVDLASPNPEASRGFYSTLFDWDSFVFPDPAAGGYSMFLKDGKQVAGCGPIFQEGQPSVWNTYVIVDDASETARKVEAAGGTVIAPPMEVMQAGHMAVFQDPTGTFISVWQPGEHKGAELVNVPGSMSWNELATRDMDRAKTFYKAVFGWGEETHDLGGGATYTEWKLNGKSIGGGMPIGPQFPPEVPPHWTVYFTVNDTDATVAKVQELGGTVLLPPTDIPQGRFAVLADQHCAAFAIIAM